MTELKYQLMLNKNMSWVPCYLKAEADAVIAELREKYELAIATIKEYKNDIANLNEKLYEAEHET